MLPDDLDDLYVSNRRHTYTDDEKSRIFRRLPKDITTRSDSSQPPLIDVLEADLLDFLLNFREHKVLLLRGPIGIGKTTFLKHMYNRIFPKYKSLHHFFPVTVDMFIGGTGKPTYSDILSAFFYAAEQQIRRESQHRKDRSVELRQFKATLAKIKRRSGGDNASSVIEAVVAVQERLPHRQLVITFDNLDHLVFDYAHSICELARGINRAASLPVIVCFRRATHSAVMASPRDRGAFYHYRIDLTPPDLRLVIQKRLGAALKRITSVTITSKGGAKWTFSAEFGVLVNC